MFSESDISEQFNKIIAEHSAVELYRMNAYFNPLVSIDCNCISLISCNEKSLYFGSYDVDTTLANC